MARKNFKEMHSIHNEGKPAVTEIFIRNLNNKNCKYTETLK